MTSLAIVPELLASLTMFPCGIYIGHLIHFYLLDNHNLVLLKSIKFGPFLAGGIAAVTTSICHVVIKFKYKRYMYEHFYFTMVGLVLLGASEIFDVFIYPTGYMPLFIGFAGHGVCYISSLTYINIRTGRSKFRSLKLSTPHVVYLLGVCTGATITWMAFKDDMSFMYINERIGIINAITCSVLFIGCLTNEILQIARFYNYKRSFDKDLNCENIFQIHSTLGGVPEADVRKIIVLSAYSIGTKMLTAILFYYPLFMQYTVVSISSNDLNIFQVQWYSLLGLILSCAMLALLKYKMTYMISILFKIICLSVLVIVCSTDMINYPYIKLIFWLVYTVLGFGFFAPNINILSYASLTVNEVVLAVGYFCEVLTIGIVQYATLINLESIKLLQSLNWHAIGCVIIVAILGLIGLFMIPTNQIDLTVNDLKSEPIKVPIHYQPYKSHPQCKCVCGRTITLHISNT